jgi:DNA (cytosine-5)-methyltransferase 1
MNHLGLFEGIGGFSLAVRWMNWKTIAWCEIDEFCQKVLRYHFPEADELHDITTTDFTKYANKIDILTGGFPCQPFSTSGKRQGTEDNRYLWKEMLRAIKEIRPNYVIAENVYGIINWNRGMVFEQVQIDLENEGYQTSSYILPACSKNAPHRRDRVFFIAHSRDSRNSGISSELSGKAKEENKGGEEQSSTSQQQVQLSNITDSLFKYSSYSYCKMFETRNNNREKGERTKQEERIEPSDFTRCWDEFPSQSPICSRDDGFSNRLDNITFPKWRAESIKAYGNAVVPQLILSLLKTIEKYEAYLNQLDHDKA